MRRNMGSESSFYLTIPSDALKNETEKAKLFLLDDRNIWVPKSQIWHESDNGDGTLSITLPEWLVLEKRLEDYADESWAALGRPD